MDISTDINNSCEDKVVSWGYKPIKTIFETLLLKKGWKQQELADYVGIDKSNMSKIVYGFYIPDLPMRLKIAAALDTDSALIWRTVDIYYIRKLLAKQKREVKHGSN